MSEQQHILEFFRAHHWINSFLGNPVKTDLVSIKSLMGLVILFYVIFFIGRRTYYHCKGIKTPSSKGEVVYEFFTDPLKGAQKISAVLLKDAIRAHYQSGVIAFARKYWLQIIGVSFVSIFIYSLAVFCLVGSQGIPIDKTLTLLNGDWNQKFGLVSSFVKNNIYLNGVVLILYISSVIQYAKINFLEGQYWDQRRLGVITTLPLGEWDETPKLNVPAQDLVRQANETIFELMNKRKLDYVRVKLASGFDTIGPNGYLQRILERPNVHWQILLLDPDSDGAGRRADAYLSVRASDPPKFKTAGDYTQSIREVIKHLAEIKKTRNSKISVRVYSHTPQWRIFLFSGIGVISGFAPGQRSDRAPLTIFEKTSTSLCYPFEEMFEDIWMHNSREVL